MSYVSYLLHLLICTGNCQEDSTQISEADPKLSSTYHKSQVSKKLHDVKDLCSLIVT